MNQNNVIFLDFISEDLWNFLNPEEEEEPVVTMNGIDYKGTPIPKDKYDEWLKSQTIENDSETEVD